MASFETLLSSVRSDTPISFFLPVSYVAFFGLAELEAAAAPPPLACLAPLSFVRRVATWAWSVLGCSTHTKNNNTQTKKKTTTPLVPSWACFSARHHERCLVRV